MRRPIVHIIDPDRPFLYGGDTDPIERSDAESQAIFRVASALLEVAECHLFQRVRTLSQVSASGLNLHGVSALPHESGKRPDATVLVGAADLLPVIRRMNPDTQLFLWMMSSPRNRWPGPARLRERFDASVVAVSHELAAELADGPALGGPGSGRLRPRQAAEIEVIETDTGAAEIEAWLALLGLVGR